MSDLFEHFLDFNILWLGTLYPVALRYKEHDEVQYLE